jgi:histone-binding protein RBBP4
VQAYRNWKKHTPFLYSTIVAKQLIWPSLSCEWLPSINNDANEATHQILLGTQTSQECQDESEIYVLQLNVPSAKDTILLEENEQFEAEKNKFIDRIVAEPHKGDVHKIRSCPQKPNHFATISGNFTVNVFSFI